MIIESDPLPPSVSLFLWRVEVHKVTNKADANILQNPLP